MESGERGSKPLCVHHLQVAQDLAGFACTVVERAARKLDHFAPPSDGPGFGPVMMEEFSLSLTRRRRGVFLTSSSSIVSCPTIRSKAAIFA